MDVITFWIIMVTFTAYFANNNTIYVVTNFLPGRNDYIFENKAALKEKLTYLLECSSRLTLYVNNK